MQQNLTWIGLGPHILIGLNKTLNMKHETETRKLHTANRNMKLPHVPWNFQGHLWPVTICYLLKSEFYLPNYRAFNNCLFIHHHLTLTRLWLFVRSILGSASMGARSHIVNAGSRWLMFSTGCLHAATQQQQQWGVVKVFSCFMESPAVWEAMPPLRRTRACFIFCCTWEAFAPFAMAW